MDVPNTVSKLNTLSTVTTKKKSLDRSINITCHTECHEHIMRHHSAIKNSVAGVSCTYCELIMFKTLSYREMLFPVSSR